MNTQTLQLDRNTVHQDNDNYIAIKPICELLEIDYRYHSKLINTHFFLASEVRKNTLHLPKGGGKPTLLLSKRGFKVFNQTKNI